MSIDYGMRNLDAEERDDWSDDDLDDYADFFEPGDDEDLRGTSLCDNTCDPQCSWCLASHECPADCAVGSCPYEALDPGLAQGRAFQLGKLDARDGTKRKRLVGVSRRHYLRGYESWIRRNDKRRRAKHARSVAVYASFDIGF